MNDKYEYIYIHLPHSIISYLKINNHIQLKKYQTHNNNTPNNISTNTQQTHQTCEQNKKIAMFL